MKVFTYVVIQFIISLAFLVVSAAATGENIIWRIMIGSFAVVLLLITFKMLHDALGAITIADLLERVKN